MYTHKYIEIYGWDICLIIIFFKIHTNTKRIKWKEKEKGKWENMKTECSRWKQGDSDCEGFTNGKLTYCYICSTES